MDKRTSEVCENAKAEGITVYTIRLDLEGDDRSETLLRNCASTNNRYLDVPDADQLDRAFEEIANDILQIYIAK